MKVTEEYIDESENTYIEVSNVEYIGNFILKITFNDGTKRQIDFKPFLANSHHPSIRKYLKEENFKMFKITDGNLNWNDYDLIFPVSDLYEGFLN